MKIGLVQVDGDQPNVALMQICSYHEQKGDNVEWWLGPMWNYKYDKVYVSKIFDFSVMPQIPEDAMIGGTGINFSNRLPLEIEKCKPSYLLYSKCHYHIGFSMKGCRFACGFCCVPKKEGRPWHNSNIDDLLLNPNGGDRLMLLDNDFFGSPNWKKDLRRIIELNLKICFVQGLNIRIITKEQAEMLRKCRFYNKKFDKRYLTFAWDKYKDKEIVMKGIKTCNEAGISCDQMQFFVLVGFDTTPEQDLERVMMLKKLDCLPFVMRYNKKNSYQIKFARWVNKREIFNTTEWSDYKHNYKAYERLKANTAGRYIQTELIAL